MDSNATEPTKPEREHSNDGLQTGSANATKTEVENQDGGFKPEFK